LIESQFAGTERTAMPLVEVVHSKVLLNVPDMLKGIRAIVARALDCKEPGGDLTETDIEVRFRKYSEDDVTEHDVAITISASNFFAREADIDRRRAEIVEWVRGKLSQNNFKFYVWVRLFPASFGEVDMSGSSDE